MTLTMNEMLEKYEQSLKKSLLLGIFSGLAFMSSANLLLLSYGMNLNLFLKITGFTGLAASILALFFFRRFVPDQRQKLRKQVQMMFAEESDN